MWIHCMKYHGKRESVVFLFFFINSMLILFQKEVSDTGHFATGQCGQTFLLQIVSDIASFVKSSEITSFPMNIEG